jgi:hypothetical protein
MAYFIAIPDIHFGPNRCHTVEWWTFQIGHWIPSIGWLKNFGKWKFQHWTSTWSYKKPRNKLSRLSTTTVFASSSCRAREFRASRFLRRRANLETVSRGIIGSFVGRRSDSRFDMNLSSFKSARRTETIFEGNIREGRSEKENIPERRAVWASLYNLRSEKLKS